ncbi:hypothetical protein EIP86_009915 [Pleurotus ostreatoroseus]|nr:hypothetical protein EIP86_009915 [Pleurotus ostreatoroseus]
MSSSERAKRRYGKMTVDAGVAFSDNAMHDLSHHGVGEQSTLHLPTIVLGHSMPRTKSEASESQGQNCAKDGSPAQDAPAFSMALRAGTFNDQQSSPLPPASQPTLYQDAGHQPFFARDWRWLAVRRIEDTLPGYASGIDSGVSRARGF